MNIAKLSSLRPRLSHKHKKPVYPFAFPAKRGAARRPHVKRPFRRLSKGRPEPVEGRVHALSATLCRPCPFALLRLTLNLTITLDPRTR